VLEGNFVSTIVGQANLVRLATLGNVHLSHPNPEAFRKNLYENRIFQKFERLRVTENRQRKKISIAHLMFSTAPALGPRSWRSKHTNQTPQMQALIEIFGI